MFLILISLFSNIDFTDSQYKLTTGMRINNCNNERINVLTDGDHVTTHSYRNPPCAIFFFVAGTSNFHSCYIVIFTGEVGSVSNRDHYLDNLVYNMSDCGRLPTRIHLIKQMEEGVRLNFEYGGYFCLLEFPEYIAEVKLAEIEMFGHELANGVHRGCFSNFTTGGARVLESFQKCFEICYSRFTGFFYGSVTMAINQPLNQCLCPKTINAENEVSLSECDAKCDNTNTSCGSNNTHSVYFVRYTLPRFDGCYNKTTFYSKLYGKKNEVKLKDLTFSKCMHYCKDDQYIWLSNVSCGCSKYFEHGMESESLLCDIPCEFNKEITCGGLEGISLYQTCKIGKLDVYCPELIHCKRGIFNHYGVCTEGCKSGFEGESCIERVSDTVHGETDEEFEVLNQTDDEKPQITSGRVMADNIASIWIAAVTFLLILF